MFRFPRVQRALLLVPVKSRVSIDRLALARASSLSSLPTETIPERSKGRYFRVATCLYCPPGKANSLSVCFEHNLFVCHRCGAKGNTAEYERGLQALSPNSEVRRDYEVVKSAFLRSNGLYSASGSNRTFSTEAVARSGSLAATTLGANGQPSVQQPLTDEERARLEQPMKTLQKEWTLEQNANPSHPAVKFLKKRGLKRDTCFLYKVGTETMSFRDLNAVPPSDGQTSRPKMIQADMVTFPFLYRPGEFDPTQKRVSPHLQTGEPSIHRYKARGVDDKRLMRSVPMGTNAQTFFGWHTIPPQAKEVVITEGEIDAMTVFQETKMPAISVPNGANAFPDSLVHGLARFDKVILWFDDDSAGRDGCEKAIAKIKQKYGANKCMIVRPTERDRAAAKVDTSKVSEPGTTPPKDANDFYLQGYDLNKLLASRRPLKHQMLVSSEELLPELYSMFQNPDVNKGQQFSGFPSLNKMLGGHRLGELTIFSGPSGSGKTTLLSQLSLDLSMSGVPTLWGSFEISIVRLQQIMFNQFVYHQLHSGWNASEDLSDVMDAAGRIESNASPLSFLKNQEAFQLYAEEFLTRCPMYFMSFFGSTEVNDVISVMRHAVEVQDVRHIVIDNLQYMVSGSGLGANWKPSHNMYNSLNKFETMDRALDHFRAFATNHKVHVSIVVHPRKVAENVPLTMDSIMGTAKASQEADNVMVIQKMEDGSKQLELKKNRFDGNLGKMALSFRPDVKCFFDEGIARSLAAQSNASWSPSNTASPSSSTRTSGATTSSSSPPVRFAKFSPNEDQALLEGTRDCVDGSEVEIFEQIREDFLPHRDVAVLQQRFRELKKIKS